MASPPPGRRELQLQGPRPAALKITKDSHKIRKPPLPPPPRQPIIIYTVSPKIIHTNATEFKDLVQRLTGRPSSSDDQASPAAHYAALQKANNSPEKKMTMAMSSSRDHEEDGAILERVGHFPAGILSPTPTLLPPIPPNIFSTPPAADLSPLTNFFQDLSPITSTLPNFFHNFPDFH